MFTKSFRRVAILGMLGALGACASGPLAGASNVEPKAASAVNQQAGVGVFFPAPTSAETRELPFSMGADPGFQRRLFFADQVNLAAVNSAAPVIVQAVGAEQRTLVFTLVDTTSEPTPYIARAMMARATSIIRFAPAIAEMGISQDLDVYSIAGILGFKSIVVTDGRKFAHDVRLQPK
jgi:hypothetical protein